MTTLHNLCVFCGSSFGASPVYVEAAQNLGMTLARAGVTLVYGGASVGTMGALADAVMAAGGEVIGVMPQALVDREIAHRGLTTLHVVASMHERKALMAELAGGFMALPGGPGTFEEFFEVWTWAQLGVHTKPCGLLNVNSYYDPFLAFLDHTVQERFVRIEHREMLLVDDNPQRLLDRFAAYQPVLRPKWIAKNET